MSSRRWGSGEKPAFGPGTRRVRNGGYARNPADLIEPLAASVAQYPAVALLHVDQHVPLHTARRYRNRGVRWHPRGRPERTLSGRPRPLVGVRLGAGADDHGPGGSPWRSWAACSRSGGRRSPSGPRCSRPGRAPPRSSCPYHGRAIDVRPCRLARGDRHWSEWTGPPGPVARRRALPVRSAGGRSAGCSGRWPGAWRRVHRGRRARAGARVAGRLRRRGRAHATGRGCAPAGP